MIIESVVGLLVVSVLGNIGLGIAYKGVQNRLLRYAENTKEAIRNLDAKIIETEENLILREEELIAQIHHAIATTPMKQTDRIQLISRIKRIQDGTDK